MSKEFGHKSRWLIHKAADYGWLLHEPVDHHALAATRVSTFREACELFAAYSRSEDAD